MANIDNARGLAPYSGQVNPRLKKYVNSTTTATGRGDIVALNSSGVVHRIATTTGSDKIVGVAANYVAAGAASTDVWVYDDPDQQFVMQDDGDSATPAQTSVGSTFALIIGAPSSLTGQSIFEIDASATGAAATDPVLVTGFITGPTQVIGKNASTIVTLNRHIYKKGSSGV